MFLFAWSLALNAVEYARRRRVARLIARFLREAALVNGRATLICRRSLRVRCHASGLRNSSQRLLDLLDQSKTELFIYENEAVEMLIKYENVFLQLDNWLLCPGYSHASVKYHKNRISFVVRLAALRRQSSIRTRRNSQRNNVEADGISASYSNSSNEKLKNESNTEGENSDFSETNTHCTEEEEEEENDECSGEESIPLPSTSIQSCLMEDESRAENLLYFLDDNAHLIAQHRKTRHLVYYESTLDAFHEIVFQWTEGKLFREDLLVEELYTVDLPPSDSMAFFGSAHSIASRQLSHDLTSLECDSSSTLSAASTQLVKLSRLSLASSSDAGTDPPYSLLEMLYLKELFGVNLTAQNRHWNNFRSEIALDSATRRQHQHSDDHNSLIGWRSELAPFGIDHAARQMWRSLSPYESHQHFLLGTRSMLDTLPQRIQSLSPVRRRVTPAHSSDQSHDQVGGSASNTLVTRHRHCSARDEVEPAGRGANRSDNAINKRGGLDSPPSSSALTMEMVPNYFLRLRMTRYAEGDFGAMSFATRDDESVGTTSESETSVPPYGELRSDVENGDVLQINSDCPIGRKTSGKTTLTATTTSANCFADPDLASILKFEDQSCLSANATNGSTTTSTFGGIETPRHASMDETITHTLSELNNTDVVESANHFPAASNTFALADALEESVKFSAICRQNMQNQTIENVRNDCYYFVPTRNFARRSQNESTDSNASVRHVPRYSQISPMYEEVGACRSFTSNLTFHRRRFSQDKIASLRRYFSLRKRVLNLTSTSSKHSRASGESSSTTSSFLNRFLAMSIHKNAKNCLSVSAASLDHSSRLAKRNNLKASTLKKSTKFDDEAYDAKNDAKSAENFAPPSAKPPSILVYTGENRERYDEIDASLRAVLPRDTYAVCNLTLGMLKRHPWRDNCACLIVASTDALDDEAWTQIQRYFNHSGKMLFLCQNALLTDLTTRCELSTKRRQLHLLKSVFDKKTAADLAGGVFGRDFGHFLKRYLGRLAKEKRVDESFQPHDSIGGYQFHVTLCKKPEQPLLLDMQTSENQTVRSCALFSDATTDELVRNGELVADALARLGVDVRRRSDANAPELTPGYLVCRKDRLIHDINNMSYRKFYDGDLRLIFEHISRRFDEDATPSIPRPSADTLPIFVCRRSDSPKELVDEFDYEAYFRALKTERFGRILLYVPVCTTTFDIAKSISNAFPDANGIVISSGYQLRGRGRGGNAWLSPKGCAIIHLNLSAPTDSPLGASIAFVQHIFAAAIVDAILTRADDPNFPIKIKWPNDIYYKREFKLGGILAVGAHRDSTFECSIGAGVNISNSKPTICVNNFLVGGKTLDAESLIAETMNKFEYYMNMFVNEGKAEFIRHYHRFWMHTGDEIGVVHADGRERERVVVRAIDADGYLEVQSRETGRVFSVRDDGNTFDLMHGLIRHKD